MPLFGSLDKAAITRLCETLSVSDYAGDTVVFRKGDPADAMYLIEQGKVRISITDADGHAATLAELGTGDFFGEMSMLDGRGRSADAIVVDHARLAKLTRDGFFSFVQNDPPAAIELLTAMSHRLRRTDTLLRHRIARNINEEEAARMTFADRAADAVAAFGGSWWFIIAAIFLLNCWIIFNSWLLRDEGFDPYPYILLSLVLNMVTALQAPIIMMSQNRQAAKDRLRDDLDYQLSLRNELVLSEILNRLDAIEKKSRGA